jgi:hypothetical protein
MVEINLEQALGITTGIFVLSAYLGIRSNYMWEKGRNIIDGAYSRLLQNRRKSDLYHKLFLLGKPNEVILNYVKRQQDNI